MRTGIITKIHELMQKNSNIYFLTGDLGYNTLEDIEQDFPKRFINTGVAEQNMLGIAAGLALSGKKVFVYSIIPFLTMRCYEQIRNDVCYHDLDVTLLGVGSGLSYGILSNTHFALEDFAILQPLPNMTIFSPADEMEAILGLQYLINFHHPVYIRIGGRQEPVIYPKPYDFKFGKGTIIRKGKDAAIFATGVILGEVIKAADLLLKNKKIKSSVIDIHTLKPIDKELIISKSKGVKAVFTVEEHGITGGLGSIVSEIIAENTLKVKIVRIGTQNEIIKTVGTRSYLLRALGLDVAGIYQKILSQLE